MGKKAKMKMIKRLANTLPLVNVETHEVHHYKGSEILEWGTITEVDGKPIDPEKIYTFNHPVKIIKNNQRALKRAYLRNGIDGVTHLMNGYVRTAEDNLKMVKDGTN